MNFFKLKFNNKISTIRKTGLTMVETLVAISILTIAVIGPLGIIAQALHSSYYTRDQMTAYYLAQEAIEYVRNSRDTQGILITRNFLADQTSTGLPLLWLDNNFVDNVNANSKTLKSLMSLSGGSNPTPTRYSMTRNIAGSYNFTPCNSGVPCSALKISTDTITGGIYGVDPNTANAVDSIFRREIYFQATNLTNPQDFVMTVNVYWMNGSSPSKLTLREYFTNWTSKIGS